MQSSFVGNHLPLTLYLLCIQTFTINPVSTLYKTFTINPVSTLYKTFTINPVSTLYTDIYH